MTPTRVCLVSSFDDPSQDTHWASPYYAMRRAFDADRSGEWTLVASPEEADLVLVCPRPHNPVFPKEIFRGGLGWRYRHKCVVLSTDDNPTITHKGIYTCLRQGHHRSPLLLGGFYPLVAFQPPLEPFPLDHDFRYLFSFRGAFSTHPVRGRIGALGAQTGNVRALIEDTDTMGAADPAVHKQRYLASIRDSKFILCPRGRCPSSVRLFETMKAQRVPVIVSDEWVPPPGIDWDTFAIRIRESEVPNIPNMLLAHEGEFKQRAAAARKAWEDNFAASALPRTVCTSALKLLHRNPTLAQRVQHSLTLIAQLATWRFLRRGVVSELAALARRSG